MGAEVDRGGPRAGRLGGEVAGAEAGGGGGFEIVDGDGGAKGIPGGAAVFNGLGIGIERVGRQTQAAGIGQPIAGFAGADAERLELGCLQATHVGGGGAAPFGIEVEGQGSGDRQGGALGHPFGQADRSGQGIGLADDFSSGIRQVGGAGQAHRGGRIRQVHGLQLGGDLATDQVDAGGPGQGAQARGGGLGVVLVGVGAFALADGEATTGVHQAGGIDGGKVELAGIEIDGIGISGVGGFHQGTALNTELLHGHGAAARDRQPLAEQALIKLAVGRSKAGVIVAILGIVFISLVVDQPGVA